MDAILAIKSVYANAIYQGIKTFEVRKTAIRRCHKIYLYETAPTSLIRGYIQVSQPIRLSVDTILQEYLPYTLLDEKELRTYAGNRLYLYLWPIIHAETIEPIRLPSRAPQSFRYI